jgi:hypothetical protein
MALHDAYGTKKDVSPMSFATQVKNPGLFLFAGV